MNESDNRFAEEAAEDPRLVLEAWANCDDEWVHFLDGQHLSTGRPSIATAETDVVASRAITELSRGIA